MRSLLVPGLLAAVAVAQSVRIEQVFAAPPRAEPAAAERAKLPVRAGGFTREPYYVEPPDVLLIETGELAFKAPYRLVAADRVVVRATGVDDERAPLAFTFTLDKQGEVDLGSEYGQVKLTGMSVAEAEEALRVHLGKKYPGAKVKVSLPKTPKPPEVAGRYLVGPDGRVDLGRYGTTYVAGHTLNQAKEVIETQLSKTLRDPKVTLDVINNSKKYYVILKSPAGDRVEMQPITGNETVLDALAATEIRIKQGTRLRVERVSREGTTLVLPVDYDEITKGGDTTTNYQLWSRDRLFIEMDGARQQAPPGPADSAPPSPGEATPREPKGSEEERRPIPAKSAEPVKVTVRLIADPKRKFNEQEGAPPRPLVGESKVMVNTTEIYAREGLLEMLVSQPMSTEKGQTAKFSTDIKESASATAFAIDLTAQGNGEQVEFDARTWLTVGGKPVAYSGAFALSKGQSYLVRLSPVAKQPADSEIYLMVTRESDGSDEPQRKDEQ